VGRPYLLVLTLLVGSVVACSGLQGESTKEPVKREPRFADAPFYSRVNHRSVTLDDGRVFFAGGVMNNDAAEIYDPQTGKWIDVGPMLEGRQSPDMVRLADGRVMIMGGSAGDRSPEDQAEIFDPVAHTFQEVRSPPKSVGQAVLMTDGRVFATSCFDKASHIYDPKTNSWAVAATPPDCTHQRLVGVAPGALMLDESKVHIYDMAADSWRVSSKSPRRHLNNGVVLDDSRVLITGLLKPNVTDPDAVVYDIPNDTWSATGPTNYTNQAEVGGSALLLVGKQIVMLGGEFPAKYAVSRANVEVWEPSKNHWLHLNDLQVARRGHTANLLPNANILVHGGQTFTKEGVPPTTCGPELYNVDGLIIADFLGTTGKYYFIDDVMASTTIDTALQKLLGAITYEELKFVTQSQQPLTLHDGRFLEGRGCAPRPHCKLGAGIIVIDIKTNDMLLMLAPLQLPVGHKKIYVSNQNMKLPPDLDATLADWKGEYEIQ
jgi:hypothetical protein